MKEKKAIYRETAKRYQKARKKEKQKILDEFVILVSLRRNYAATLLRSHGKKLSIRDNLILQGDITKKVAKRGRKKKYDSKVLEVLIKIWKIMDFICGKRLKASLSEVMKNLKEHGHINIDSEIELKLHQISASTIDRILRHERKKLEIRGISGTKPGTILKSQISIRTWSEWDENKPGYFEIDLVGHEGGNSQGDFAQSLDMVDVYSGWTETIALKNKASLWVRTGLDKVRTRLPFPLLGIDSDNGSEFINHHMVKYCEDKQITFTRGRSTRSNDNCYVEQKNYSIVRRAVGYNRYDTEDEVDTLNQLYDNLRLYTNHFQPVMKMKEKIRNGSKVKKRYFPPVVPYDAIMDCSSISHENKEKLKTIHDSLDLYDLKKQITKCQNRLAFLARKKRESIGYKL